jgi:hypothetical protein
MAETTVEETPILVEFADEYGVVEATLSPADMAQRSAEALERAMDTIEAMARRVSALRHSLPDEFTQVEVAFGVKLDVEAGALLAKAGGEASLAVTLTWERGDRDDG